MNPKSQTQKLGVMVINIMCEDVVLTVRMYLNNMYANMYNTVAFFFVLGT